MKCAISAKQRNQRNQCKQRNQRKFMKGTISAIIEIFRKIRYQHVQNKQLFPYYELTLQYKP